MVNYTFNKDKCQANGAPTCNRRVKSVGKNYSIHIDTGKFTVYNKINLVQ